MEKSSQPVRGGFSLLEGLIALVIALIIGALAYSQIAHYLARAKVRSFAEEVYYNLEYARNLAFQVGSSKVVFNPSDFEIYAPETATTPVRKVEYPDGVTVDSGIVVVFKRNKTISGGGSSVCVSNGDASFSIVFDNVSGRIRMEQGC